MENLEYEITSRSYRIKVPDIRLIMDKDGVGTETLFYKILTIEGVHDADYDGHFGYYVYVTIDDYDHEKVMDEILETILEYISEEY